MRRITLAMALGCGLGLAFGCGPSTPDDTNEKVNAAPPAEAPIPPPPGGGGPSGGGPGGGAGGPPTDITKGMESSDYRKMMGSEGPGGAGKPAPDAKGEAPKKDGEAPKNDGEAPKKDGEAKADPVALTDDEIAAIKKLPDPEDQKLALAQKICLVGEDEGKPNHLGSMGSPIKEVVKGKTVFVCCKGCVDDLKKDPDKYLSKLGK